MRTPRVTAEELAAFQAEAERMGLTVAQYAELIVQGAVDALEERIAQWQRDDEGRAVLNLSPGRQTG